MVGEVGRRRMTLTSEERVVPRHRVCERVAHGERCRLGGAGRARHRAVRSRHIGEVGRAGPAAPSAMGNRIFVGNALFWKTPRRFDFVRTEIVYVPRTRRREYVERLLNQCVAARGRLIVCSYGSSRPEGARAEPLVEEVQGWGLAIDGIHDAVSPEHGFVITRVVSVPSHNESLDQGAT